MFISPFFSVTAKQIGILRGLCYKTARKEFHAIRDALALESSVPLTLRHLASYWDVPVGELTGALYKTTLR